MTAEFIEFSAKAETADERTITGLAIPYGVTTRDGRKHQFTPGAVDATDLEDVKLHFNHDPNAVIGSVFSAEETDEGLSIKARISQSARGEEIYTLIREGHLNELSVGIVGREFREEDDVTVWTKADLHEVSVVPRPAFRTAAIERVYSAQADSTTDKEIDDNTMSEVINTEVVELKEAFADLERKVALAGTQTPVVQTSKFASAGEALFALAKGDQAAKQVFAFTGATTADANVGNATVAGLAQVVETNRPILNLFKKAALPASGNTVQYAVRPAGTGTVGVQATEGADLPYMEVQHDDATAPVKTYGGYSSLSRQAIERSDVSYLDSVLRYQAEQYAAATNAAVKTAVATATGTSVVPALEAENGASWLRLAGRSRRAIKVAKSQAGVMLVSYDVYERLISLVDSTGRPLFDLNGDGANTIGNAGLANVDGRFAGLNVVIDDSAADDTVWILGSDAVTVFEQPGAPVRLQDENIINLTKDFSLYGYMAIGVTNPGAIVRASVAI